MTLPLITIKAPCGCPLNEGHYCCPPWVDETNWPVSGGAAINDKRIVNTVESGVINESAPAGNGGLTPPPESAGRELPPMVVDARPLDNTSEAT